MMQPKLSILICSLTKRKHLLDRLMAQLDKQRTSEIEILIETDNGDKPTGVKRNILKNHSTGLYQCYIDDDDEISPDYCKLILECIEHLPDCVGISGIMTIDRRNPTRFVNSLAYILPHDDGVELHCPVNHLNPIRKDIADKVKFPPIRRGEDTDYAANLYALCADEIWIQEPIYFYNYSSTKGY